MGDTFEKVCLSCCKRLVEAYEFKLFIESSDATFWKSNKTKRINFNNIEDIKIEIPDEKPIKALVLDDIKIEDIQFDYHNTSIRRVEGGWQPLVVPLVVDYLNFVKEEPESDDEDTDIQNDENDQPYENYNYNSGSSSGEEEISTTNLNRRQTRNKTYDEINNLTSDYDELATPLNKRKTRNREYDEIKPVIRKKWKKKDKEDFDEDYKPRPVKKPQKIIEKTCKKAMGRPPQGRTFAVPVVPQVIDNMTVSIVRDKIKKPKEKKHVCHHCGKLLYLQYLDVHLLSHSAKPSKLFKCDKCPKAFTGKNKLLTHFKRHEPKTIKCEHCIASFSFKSEYLNHLASHSTEKNYVCELCSKAFKTSQRLKKHKFHSHNIGLIEVKCDLCDKVCKTKELLRHHYRVHTRERPYNCEICSQPYSYKHDFNRHCLKKHGVLFKFRSVYVMNEEVLVKERALMKDLMLRINGVNKDNLPENPFEGPLAVKAYEKTMKYLETQQLPVDFQL